MKKIFFLLVICLFFSCDRDDSCGCFNLDVGVDFIVLNKNNEDLLNKNTPNTLNTDNIRIEYLHNTGSYIPFYMENSFNMCMSSN